MHPSDAVDDGAHGAAGVPNAFQAVPAGAHDERRPLGSCAPEMHGRQVIPQQLKPVVQVVEVLDLSNGPQSPHGQADALPQDRALPNPDVENAVFTERLLHAFHGLIDPANAAGVLPKSEQLRVAFKQGFEVVPENDAPIFLGISLELWRHRLHIQRAQLPFDMEVSEEQSGTTLLLHLQPLAQRVALWRDLTRSGMQGLPHGRMDVPANGVHDLGEGLRSIDTIGHGAQQFDRGFPLSVECLSHSGPRGLLFGTDGLLGLLADGLELLLGGRPFKDQKARQLSEAIEFFGPGQPLRGFVALVRPTGAVPLWLGAFLHVHENRHVTLPTHFDRPLIGEQQGGVVPSPDLENHDSPSGQFRLGFCNRDSAITSAARF